jgi:alpha-L-fucosidase
MLEVAVLAALASVARVPARGAGPDADIPAAQTWLEDAKFGLFVHWGVSALVGKGEWVMEQDKLPISEYEKLPPRFNPTELDAQRWVKAVKDGGQKYLVITVKGHDGFALFESALTSYDIVDASPYGKDPLKDLAEACHQQDIKLFFYYSLLDWHHPDYFPRGKTGRHTGRPEQGDWAKYVAYYQGQVRELCTQYGTIGGFLFDGAWDRSDADWDLEGTRKLIRTLQPGALVANNQPGLPRAGAGADYQIANRDPAGGGGPGNEPGPGPVVSTTLPQVWCTTLAGALGAGAGAGDPKDPAPIIHALLDAAGQGAGLLLEVGAKPDGTLSSEFIERLLATGKWLDQNGRTVYGTRRGPVPPQRWGVTVGKPGARSELGAVYLHVTRPEIPIRLPRSLLAFDAWLEGKAEHLDATALGNEILINLPEKDRTPIDTIVVLRPKGYPR